jgi:hypothetical protein
MYLYFYVPISGFEPEFVCKYICIFIQTTPKGYILLNKEASLYIIK